MKYEPGGRLTAEEMAAKVEVAVAGIHKEFLELFGRMPYPDDLVWECMQKKCGWWDRTEDDLLVIERVYEDNRNGVIIPGGRAEVQLLCPECRFPIQARNAEAFLAAARANGSYTTTMALRNRGHSIIIS